MKNKFKEKIRVELKSKYPEFFQNWKYKDLSAQHRFRTGDYGETILYLDKYIDLVTDDGGRTWGAYEGRRTFPERCNLGIFPFGNELIAIGGKWLTRSIDSGRSWEPYSKIPSAIDVHHSNLIGPNAFSAIQMSTGRIVIVSDYFVGQEGPDTQLLCSTVTDDGGHTWQHSKLFGPAMPLPQGPEGFGEPAVVQLASSWLWMIFRTLYGELWQSISNDGGLTWQPAVPTGLASPIANCYAKSIPGSAGIVLSWNLTKPGISTSFTKRESLYRPRTNLVFSVSWDNCRSWSCPITVEKFGGFYPTIYFTEKEMFILYQSNVDETIVAAKPWYEYGLTLVVYDLDDVKALRPWTKETIQPFIDKGLVAHWLSLNALPKNVLEIID